MSNRITITTLQSAVARLNRIANTDIYTLDAAYGGYRLCQRSLFNGGERDLSDRASARETFSVINAFINGYEAAVLARAMADNPA
jgi:hypothetical protein